MLQYMSIIRKAETKDRGLAWRQYDEQFRQRQAVNLSRWSKINADLWLRIMTATPSFGNYASTFQPPTQYRRIPKSAVCLDYNNARCHFNPCKFPHSCQACSGQHPVRNCPRSLPSPSPTSFPQYRQRTYNTYNNTHIPAGRQGSSGNLRLIHVSAPRGSFKQTFSESRKGEGTWSKMVDSNWANRPSI